MIMGYLQDHGSNRKLRITISTGFWSAGGFPSNNQKFMWTGMVNWLMDDAGFTNMEENIKFPGSVEIPS
jgi:hypothetical protein